MRTKAVLIAGAGSGSGKTTLTLGLLAALRKKGLKVQGFKAGPDYIDPSLHRIVTGKPSINLDTWMMPRGFLRNTFTTNAANADVSVIEGVMGLHDGRDPDSATGSTAELAAELKVPVVLVISAVSMARTAAAVVNGLVSFDPKVRVIGVVFNHLGSPKHLALLEKAVNAYCPVPVLGGILRNQEISMPSRHLGLYMGEDGILDNDKIELLASAISSHVNVDKILSLAEMDVTSRAATPMQIKPSTDRIAVARDTAFCFYYDDNFNILKRLGYEIVFFSPLHDRYLPKNVSLVYFGGGYPELYAEDLSGNEQMRKSVLEASQNDAFIYAECGGLMYLGETLTTVEGASYPMCGCLPYATNMRKRLQSLGYTEVEFQEEFLFFKKGTQLRGHSFHYSEMIMSEDSALNNIYAGCPNEKAKGYRIQNTLASYAHLHFAGLVEGFR